MQILDTIAKRYFSVFGISVLSLGYKEAEHELPRVQVMDCNDVFLSFFELRREEVVGHPLSRLLEGESYGQTLQYMYMSMKLGKHGSAILPLHDGQGRMRRMEIEFFPLSDHPPVDVRREILWCWLMRPAKN